MEEKYDASGMNRNTYKILFDNEMEQEETVKRIVDKNKVFNYCKLSDYINVNEMEEILKTTKEKSKCHMASTIISGMLGIENRILSGCYIKNNKKYFHSVVEVTGKKGTVYILDYVYNMIMEKEQYIELTQFEEIEAITDTEYQKDIERIINKFSDKFSMKLYLAFRTEIIKDLKRNEKIFEEEER